MSGCSNCSGNKSSAGNSPPGCNNNGHCANDGCNKLASYDWLADMEIPGSQKFDIIEVRFKNGRKGFYRNTNNLILYNGDSVIVDVPNGHHLGYVCMQGELVRLQMSKKKVENNDDIRAVYRIATQKDLTKYGDICKKENPALYRTREIIESQKLAMKLTDVEYQADGTKATFYYSADERVDFRDLIKVLAAEFKIRIEMRQISLRQEASRLGGIGSCGRELCCSTWLTDFKSVTTSAARYQNLSLNPSKLSGQCGRLKCCLNYELETYMNALSDIPTVDDPLLTQKGEAKLQKTDIFKMVMWFGYEKENAWISIPVNRVKEILKMNAAGDKPASLKENNLEIENEASDSLNSDLEQLDRKFKRKTKKKRKNKRRGYKPKPKN